MKVQDVQEGKFEQVERQVEGEDEVVFPAGPQVRRDLCVGETAVSSPGKEVEGWRPTLVYSDREEEARTEAETVEVPAGKFSKSSKLLLFVERVVGEPLATVKRSSSPVRKFLRPSCGSKTSLWDPKRVSTLLVLGRLWMPNQPLSVTCSQGGGQALISQSLSRIQAEVTALPSLSKKVSLAHTSPPKSRGWWKSSTTSKVPLLSS